MAACRLSAFFASGMVTNEQARERKSERLAREKEDGWISKRTRTLREISVEPTIVLHRFPHKVERIDCLH